MTGSVTLIPRRVLFGNPERVNPHLSPDGTRLAWIAPHDGVLNVWVAPATATEGIDWASARVITDDAERGVRKFGWAHDGRHLLYLQDTGGDENWHLHDVDLESMRRRDLTPFDGVSARIVAANRNFPTEVLIGLNRDNPRLHDVYRADLVSGELTLEVKNPGLVGWLADQQKDAEFLWSRSPLSRVSDIRIPLLIAQGANDPRVKQAESEQIVAALRDAGIPFEYMLFPDEGHGLAKPENRLRFYAAAERFLGRHLGGRAEE